jgi:hypothetical protein
MSRGFLLLSCWMLALAASTVYAGPPPAVFAECIARLDSQTDVGFARIAARCPELVQQLQEGDWAAWLPRGWQDPGNDLSAGGLRELQALGRAATPGGQMGRTPRLQSLSQILDRLPRSNEGRWSSVERWLRSWFGPEPQIPSGSDAGFLARLSITATTVEVLAASALAATLLFFGWIIFGEWRSTRSDRAAGRLAADAPQTVNKAVAHDEGQTQVREPQPRGWMDRPRDLLALLLAELARRRDLPPTGALTVRELTSMARLVDVQRRQLVALAVAAERLRFAATPPEQVEVQHCLDEGERLLHELRGPDPA